MRNAEDSFWPYMKNIVTKELRPCEFNTYVLALEGWQRGLTLKWYIDLPDKLMWHDLQNENLIGKVFSLSSQEKTHYFFQARGDKITQEAIEICSDSKKLRDRITVSELPNLMLENQDFITKKYPESSIYKIYVVEEKVIGAIKLFNGQENKSKTVEKLDDKLKRFSIETLKSIQGLYYGAIYILVNKQLNDKKNTFFVLDVKLQPSLKSFLFPDQGRSQSIAKALIDFYFPETKNHKIEQPYLYFDYYEVLRPLEEGAANVTKVRNLNNKEFTSKHMIINKADGKLEAIKYIRTQALKRGLIGRLKKESNDCLSLKVAGENENLESFLKEIKKTFPKYKVLTEMKNEPLKVGFEIVDMKRLLIDEVMVLNKQITTLQNEETQLRRKYYKMLNSLSWRITAPIRMMTGFLKRITK